MTTISFTTMKLSQTELESIFSNLGLGTSQTITVSSNWGAVTPISLSGTTTAGSTTITMANTTGITTGMQVTGTGTPSTTAIAVTTTDAGDLVTKTAHGLSNDDEVSFATVATTTSISVNRVYKVANKATDNFQLKVVEARSEFLIPATMNGSTTGALLKAVTVNSSGLFVAVGYNSSNYPVFATSAAGTSWTTPALMNSSSVYSQMNGVTVNSSGLFVAVGKDTNTYPVFATSADGTSWSTPTLMNSSSVYASMSAITVNSSGKFVAVGKNGSSYPVFATSADGSTWTTPAIMVTGSTVYGWMQAITVNSSGLFVAVGYNSSNYPVFATSADGSTWTNPIQLSEAQFYLTAIAVNSSGFVAVGRNSSNYPIYSVSADGIAWTPIALMNESVATGYMGGVAVNSSGLFVAIGFNVSWYPLYSYKYNVAVNDIQPIVTNGTGTIRYKAVVDTVNTNTSVVLSRPATGSATNTLAFRDLKTNTALLKGWTVTG
jgi:hypothetical protein